MTMLASQLRYYLASLPPLLVGIRPWPRVVAAFLGLPLRGPFAVGLRTPAMRFAVRGAMDIWILKETCLDRAYERAAVPLENGWTVIDIGAGLGDFALYAARLHPRSMVYAFEPAPDSFQLLVQNMHLNGIRNVQPFAQAVGGKPDDQLALRLDGAAVQYSTAAAQAARTGDAATVRVASTSLDQLFTDHCITQCDFLKLDCEGAEYDILFNASSDTLRRVQHICLEYHDGVTEYTHRALIALLRDHGFVVRTHPNPVHRHLGLLAATRAATP